MKLENVISGKFAFLFFTGYFCTASCLILLLSSVTPFYVDVGEIAKKIPLSTVLLASPLAIIVGLLFNSIRTIINEYIFKRKIYDLSSLPDETKQALAKSIHDLFPSIDVNTDIGEDSFSNAKARLLPEFDEYSINDRWIHDFLDSAIYVSVISIVVLLIRVAINSLRGLDLYILTIMAVAFLFPVLSLKKLKAQYTKLEVAVMLRSCQGGNEKERLKPM